MAWCWLELLSGCVGDMDVASGDAPPEHPAGACWLAPQLPRPTTPHWAARALVCRNGSGAVAWCWLELLSGCVRGMGIAAGDVPPEHPAGACWLAPQLSRPTTPHWAARALVVPQWQWCGGLVLVRAFERLAVVWVVWTFRRVVGHLSTRLAHVG